MKSISPIQVFVLLCCLFAAPCILRGEKKEDPKGEKVEDVAEKTSKTDETGPAGEESVAEVEEKPDPEAEFAELVKAEVYATKLPGGRRAQLQAMAMAAYRETELGALWADSVDLAKVNEALVSLLERHAFEEPAPAFNPKPEPADWAKKSPVPHEDLLVTLSVAEASLLLKQGPDTVSKWPNWSFGDHPAVQSTDAHWRDIAERFGETAAGSDDPRKVAEAFIPRNRIYQHLFEAIEDAELASEPPELTVKKVVRVGHKFEQAGDLARFLAAEGHLAEELLAEEEPEAEAETEEEPAGEESEEEKADEGGEKEEEPGIKDGIFTKELSDALKEYQEMNGLQADGILGPKTARRISDGDEEKAKALRINLHRARRFPDNPGEKYLQANIPSGEIYGFSAGEETIRMRIVFGKNILGQRTPIFRDEMEQVVFRPYWNVPYNIAVSEGNYSDTDYLARNGFEIISSSGRELPITVESLALVRERKSYVRQNAGTNNALGLVKFLFPNRHSVYFHDTPHKHYFKSSYRARSHGCVRLEKPEKMANWVLEEHEEWDSSKISSALKGRRQEVSLDETIPVYVTYYTALPDATRDDKIGFYQDIYRYDRPGAVVDAPGPRVKHIELPDERTRTPFFLFRRSDEDKSRSGRSTTSSTARRGSLLLQNRR